MVVVVVVLLGLVRACFGIVWDCLGCFGAVWRVLEWWLSPSLNLLGKVAGEFPRALVILVDFAVFLGSLSKLCEILTNLQLIVGNSGGRTVTLALSLILFVAKGQL